MRIRIPDVSRAAVEDRATVAAVRRMSAAARADTAALGDANLEAAPVASEDMVRVEGVLEAGDPCMGVPAAEEECGQSPTLELRILYRART